MAAPQSDNGPIEVQAVTMSDGTVVKGPLFHMTVRPDGNHDYSPKLPPAVSMSPCQGGLDSDTGPCCPTGTYNDIGGVQETAAIGCDNRGKCDNPKEWWDWDCKGNDSVPPVMFWSPDPGSGRAWEFITYDFPQGFRDKNLLRHFIKHAGWFETTPIFSQGVLVGGPPQDLLAAVAPPSLAPANVVATNSMFSAIRVDINVSPLNFQRTQLTVTVGPSPSMNPNSAFDNPPSIIHAMNEGSAEQTPRGITGWQCKPNISLILPLGLVRQQQTVPNLGLATLSRFLFGLGPLVPTNVRVSGAAPGTTMRASYVSNASAGIAQLANSV